MVTCEQSIEKFVKRMDELISSKYIVADGKVSEVLKAISESELLFELFEHVTKCFDYKTFKSICFVKKDGKGSFNLPKNDEDIIAFGFLILMELDTKRIDLLRLLSDYFPSEDGKQISFNIFAESLLLPFKQTTEKVAYKLIIGDNDEQMEAENEAKKEYDGPIVKVKSPRIEVQVLDYLNIVSNAIEKAKREKEKDQLEELYYVLSEFLKFIKNGNFEGVTLSFTALKYMSEVIKKVRIDYDLLAQLLAEVM